MIDRTRRRVAARVAGLLLTLAAGSGFAEPPEGLLAFVVRSARQEPTALAAHLYIQRGQSPVPSNLFERFAFDIGVVRADGSDYATLTADGLNRHPRWSYDGQWIAFLNGQEPNIHLDIIRPDGSERRRVLDGELRIDRFWWSHDSRKLLVSVGSRRGDKVWEGRVIDLDTGTVARLTNSDWMKGWNHWEPGRQDVVNPRPRLTDTLKGVEWPVWSPDAEYIAFLKDGLLCVAHAPSVSNSGRWVPFQNEPPADAVPGDLENDLPGWSWDGRRFLFRVNRTLAIADLEKGRWTNIRPVSTRRDAADPTLNADGSYAAYASIPPGKGNREIFIVDENGVETQVTETRVDHLHLHWQPIGAP